MKTLPPDVSFFSRTPTFTNEIIPAGLLERHCTRPGFWALIHVIEGELEYTIDGQERHLLQPGKQGVIEPGVLHHVTPLGPVAFYVEFYRSL